jgi:predicted transposase YbfD/YdcC
LPRAAARRGCHRLCPAAAEAASSQAAGEFQGSGRARRFAADAGNDRFTAVGQWVRRAGQADLARLRAPWDPLAGRYRAPDEKTIRVILDRLAPRALARALLGPRPRRARCPGGPPSASVRDYRARRAARQAKALARSRLRAVAVDGKTSRGARRADGTRVHLLGAAEHGGHLLDHLEVGIKHNETSHGTELLEPLDLAGAAVTFDALHAVRANLNWLAEDKQAHYIAVVKKNQPLLHAQVKALPWRQIPGGSCARDTGHGRIETRTLKAAHVSRLNFPRARQAIKITRRRENASTGKITRETVYAVTSLTSADATTQDLARLVREHWSIEVHHHVRDLTFSEDTATSRTGNGPVNLATIIAAIKDAGLPAYPRRPARPQHPRRNSPPPRPRLGQERTFTEHAGALEVVWPGSVAGAPGRGESALSACVMVSGWMRTYGMPTTRWA